MEHYGKEIHESAEGKAGVLIPADAVVERDGGSAVFVVEDERAVLRKVVVGRTLGEDREITEGLSGGERVVIAPAESLTDGARVGVAADPAAAEE